MFSKNLRSVLVTGVSGLLGGNFAVFARQHFDHVFGSYNQHPLKAPGLTTFQADLSDPAIIPRILEDYHPQWVVHCAAITQVDWCEEHPEEAWRVNVETSKNLAQGAQRIGAHFLYISSDSVFDGKKGQYCETDEPGPVNVYARTKLAGERAVEEKVEDPIIIRTNMYGWNFQEKLSLSEWVFSNLSSGKKINGFCDVIFSPLLVNDLSCIIVKMMQQGCKGVFHVSSSQACSKLEFAQKLAGTFGFDLSLIQAISVAEVDFSAPRPLNTSLESGKISRELNLSMPNIESGIHEFKRLREMGFVEELAKLRGGG